MTFLDLLVGYEGGDISHNIGGWGWNDRRLSVGMEEGYGQIGYERTSDMCQGRKLRTLTPAYICAKARHTCHSH